MKRTGRNQKQKIKSRQFWDKGIDNLQNNIKTNKRSPHKQNIHSPHTHTKRAQYKQTNVQHTNQPSLKYGREVGSGEKSTSDARREEEEEDEETRATPPAADTVDGENDEDNAVDRVVRVVESRVGIGDIARPESVGSVMRNVDCANSLLRRSSGDATLLVLLVLYELVRPLVAVDVVGVLVAVA